MSRADHMDVAAYALGVLDAQDAERFEEHLATCWACAAELETMVPVVGLLSGIDGEAMAALEQTHTDPALLDRTLIRVGNEAYRRENGTYGLTTLEADQVEIDGAEISFCFIGKGGQEHEVSLDDRRLARAVKACHELGGRELFTYRGVDGGPVRVDSADCNEYLADVMGPDTTVKYFRTWGATATVLEELAGRPEGLATADVLSAVDLAAERLGNTRAVCRRSYVHPLLTDDLDEPRLRDAWAGSRTTESMTRAERATLRLLDG